MSNESLIPKHGGFRKLKSFQVAQLVYDVTVRFCHRYVDARSRTRGQMIQAARSGVQNIAEGSEASATSKKTELKLTNVAQASLVELALDYEDFLRQNNLLEWESGNTLRQLLIDARCSTADDVAHWVAWVRDASGQYGQSGHSTLSRQSTMSISSKNKEISANAALVLISVARGLLKRQIRTLAEQFEDQGGFTEKLYNTRKEKKRLR